MADKIKLGEISKNLKITNKDIIAKLAEFGVELHKLFLHLTLR